jgi:hypothetical protein
LAERDPDGHVNFATFGYDKLKDRQRYHDLITKTKRMDSHTTTLLWREYYESHFGIFNHDQHGDPKLPATYRPLALVALHPKEDSFSYSLLHRFMWKFCQYKIKDTWGYNLSEFLALPWYHTQDIFNIEQRRAAEEMRREEERRKEEEQRAAEVKRQNESHQQPNYNQFRYVPTNQRGGRS